MILKEGLHFANNIEYEQYKINKYINNLNGETRKAVLKFIINILIDYS